MPIRKSKTRPYRIATVARQAKTERGKFAALADMVRKKRDEVINANQSKPSHRGFLNDSAYHDKEQNNETA